MHTRTTLLGLLLVFFLAACDTATTAGDEGGEPDGFVADVVGGEDVVISLPDVASSNPEDVATTAPDIGEEKRGPQAVVACDEGEAAIPQTNLHLNAGGSVAEEGDIVRWEWRVEQPEGSRSVFRPSNTVPTPSFEANVAGRYTFYLDVWDEEGNQSPAPACFEIDVVPDDVLHIELLWRTPVDPDETDTGPFAGSDMDLHLIHPNAPTEPDAPDLDGDGAPDPFYSQPYDCYWFNPHPDWGVEGDSSDNPGLDRDDTDGAGPENINLDAPQDDTRYQVAVQYWNDHGYGVSFATVRIYVYGELVWEEADVEMRNYELWPVATVDWPEGTVTPITNDAGGLVIVPEYKHPIFFDD